MLFSIEKGRAYMMNVASKQKEYETDNFADENIGIIQPGEVVYLPVDRIGTNPYQPRRAFEREQLMELAESIRQYGVMQPVSVRCINGSAYELVAGERRLRACRLLGLATIPAIIVTVTDRESAVIALIENLQRENLNYIEEAEGFINLISDYSLTQEQLARQIGKSQSAIANKLRILKLPHKVKAQLIEHGLSERHARALLRLGGEDEQLQALRVIVEDEMTVKSTDDMVERILRGRAKNSDGDAKSRLKVIPYVKDIRLFTNTIKQAVEIMKNSGISTLYDIKQTDNGCFINIMVTY
jgi:ParB family chromosome partitioning protein